MTDDRCEECQGLESCKGGIRCEWRGCNLCEGCDICDQCEVCKMGREKYLRFTGLGEKSLVVCKCGHLASNIDLFKCVTCKCDDRGF